jgi:hypothetical protein
MKKALLLTFALMMSIIVVGQKEIKFREGLEESKMPETVFTTKTSNVPIPQLPQPAYKDGSSSIVLREMGQSGNGFGLLGDRQFLWANPAINTVSFIHRMNNPPQGPGSGYLAYDYSLDGGTTWVNNVQIYDPSPADFEDARYPQHGVYNPPDNTNPEEAVLGYFAATLDGTNGGTWGGYGFGSHQFSTAEPPTQHGLSTSGDFLQGVPSAYTISSQGLAICVDPAKVGSTTPYTDFMILTKGHYNPEIGDFEMDRYLEFMPAGGASPVSGVLANVSSNKVAFSPDGQIGYIAYLSDNGENTVESDGCYYPILYKSTDAGESWEGPYNVQLGGVDGLPVVLEYLRDELIEILFEPPLPEREDIPFTSAFEIDLSVDYAGNPHLIFSVGVGSQEYSIFTSHAGAEGCDGMVAMIHVFSTNGGEDWFAHQLGLLHNFRGEFPYTGGDPVSVDNRPYVASNPAGTKMFFSWIDTNVPDYGENDQPDIYCVGHDVINKTYSDQYVVTEFSAAWFNSFMGTGSKYVLDHGDGSYTVPFVYQQINPFDLIDPVQFWYVDNFMLSDADLGLIQNTDELEALNFTISQNYPNPCEGHTFVDVTTTTEASLSVDISNMIGQVVWKGQTQNVGAGKHQMRLNTAGLKTGIYLYNVYVDGKVISGKLAVK